MQTPSVIRRVVPAAIVSVLTGAFGFALEPARPTAPADWPAIREETFTTVWQTVNESYFDPTFGGVDWVAVGEKYRSRLAAVSDNPALRGLLQEMLGELRRSHFAIMPRDEAVFTPQERTRVGAAGLEVAYADGSVVVSAIEAGSGAAAAGLNPGDVVLEVGDLRMDRLGPWFEQAHVSPARRGLYLAQWVGARLRGPVGTKTGLMVRSVLGIERSVELTFAERGGEWSEPMGDFPSVPITVQARCGPDGLAYLHFNVFARLAMKDIKALLRAVPADGGLVLDLRGNLGGIAVMASGISGWLSDRQFPLGTMQLRQGHIGFTVSPQTGAFLGPVAVLIDSSSASTSEIMAAGLQESGRVRVFGETSPGSALPSLFKALPTGDLLQHAVADLQTPQGVLIEGRGVIPDEPVQRTITDFAVGRDPVLAAAQRWLDGQRRQPVPLPPPGGNPP